MMSRQACAGEWDALVELVQKGAASSQTVGRQFGTPGHPIQKRRTMSDVAQLQRIITMSQESAELSRSWLSGGQNRAIDVERGVWELVRRPYPLEDSAQGRIVRCLGRRIGRLFRVELAG